MTTDTFEKLIELVREKNRMDEHSTWAEGSKTYFREVKLELEEVAQELNSGRNCYLEDELGDVLWDYLNLLASLDTENKIQMKRVFERCLEKYRERVEAIKTNTPWSEIKAIQKERLAKEQERRENA